MSKELVKELFGANAANYVVSNVHAKGASLARLVELVGPAADWQGLDIATGGGHTALVFAPHVKHMIASDLTREMLDQVEKQVTDKGIDNVGTQVADAEALPFDDGQFNLVTCRIAPHHFPDIPKFVAEAFRVLKPGGTFALVDNAAPDEVTNPDFDTADLAEAAATYNNFEKIRDPSHGRAWTASEWLECIDDAGFNIEHTEILPKKMSFDAWINNMSVPAEKVPGLAAMLHDAKPAFAAYIQKREDDNGLGFTIAELLVIGRKPT
ncbi:MAG: methyltransferase domain-containing protein [Hyphomicrobiaceae bacterium]